MYCKTPKNSDTRKFAVISLKVEQGGVMRPKDAEEIANSVDPDLGAVCTVCPGLPVPKLRIITVIRATENRFFAGLDRFLVCKTDSVCIKRIFFGPKKHTLRIIYWPNYLDKSSVKPLIAHNYSNYQCCQHIGVTESWKMRSRLITLPLAII